MASSANISAVTTANTFDNWRIQTNLGVTDVNEICRGNFYKPAGFANVAHGYLELANTTGGFVALRIPYADATITGGKLTVKKIDQIESDGFIYAGTNDIRYTNDALQFIAMGNTRTVRLHCNTFASIANINAYGFIETTGLYSNVGAIMNIGSHLVVSNNQLFGNTTVTSNIRVSKNAFITGTTNLLSTLAVTNDTWLQNRLFVYNTSNLYSSLSVAGNTFLQGNVSVTYRANVGGTVNIGSTLEVFGNTHLYSNVYVSKNAFVTGTTNLFSTLGVASGATLQNTLTVFGVANLVSNVNIGGITTLQTIRIMEAVVNNDIGLAGTRAIYKFPTDTYRSGKLLIEVESVDGGNVQMSEAIVTCNATLAHTTVYATVSTPPAPSEGSSLIGTFSSAVVSGNAEIYLTTTFNNCKTKVVADLIK